MSTLPQPQVLKQERKSTLRMFYVFVVLAAGTFTVAVNSKQPAQQALYALGILLAGWGIWSFLRFLKVADTHQRLINHEATSFAFVAVGILQRLGFLSGASLLVPALMIALWSIGLILFSWRYQQ
jgi:hypothetical protein